MERPPRRRTERLLSWPLLARAYLFLGPMQAIAAMAAFFFVLGAAGWSYGEPLARSIRSICGRRPRAWSPSS